MRPVALLIAGALWLTSPGIALAEAQLAPLFRDGMIVQAGKPVPVWGKAAPLSSVTVTMGETSRSVAADEAGAWHTSFDARRPGERFAISAREAGGPAVEISSLVAGEVWLCAGQSNMDLKVRDAANADRVLERAGRLDIRIAKLRRQSTPKASTDMAYDIAWERASGENLGDFSSACWHMGEQLARHTGQPVGLIQATWGGTSIKDWISAGTMSKFAEAGEALEMLDLYSRDAAAATSSAVDQTEEWIAAHSPSDGLDSANRAGNLDTSHWGAISLPQMWENADVAELSAFNGIAWFSRQFALTDAEPDKSLVLQLGRIDERDTVWVNGHLVGAEVDPARRRIYPVPPAFLVSGQNRITIRVLDERGSGGFRSPPQDFAAMSASGRKISLSGAWHYRLGANMTDLPPAPAIAWQAPRGLTTLYNGMIAPLAPLQLRGIAWYQGESDTGPGSGYDKLLPALLSDWRRAFAQPDLPFVIVQLPRFGKLAGKSVRSSWAELREVQRRVSASDPSAELAVLIDTGEPGDIHPRHKQVVGERMAIAARRIAYDEDDLPTSPVPQSVTRSKGSIIVSYSEHAQLLVVSGLDPIGFEICEDQQDCWFPRARLEGSKVILSDPQTRARWVRLAWQDAPIINLFGPSMLPAAPFAMPVAGE